MFLKTRKIRKIAIKMILKTNNEKEKSIYILSKFATSHPLPKGVCMTKSISAPINTKNTMEIKKSQNFPINHRLVQEKTMKKCWLRKKKTFSNYPYVITVSRNNGFQGTVKSTRLIEKSTKILSMINFFLFQLGIINILILTYFYIQQNITFRATGWFPIPENIYWWYHIFLVLIIVRMLIVFTTYYLAEYIKKFSLWTEKKKKNALHALAVINLLTFPINLPLIGGLYGYIQGREIISNNWFLGTFRRILTENERENLYQGTVQNFLEKIETSKEIKDQIKNWAIENTKTILEKYDEGSVFATEYLSEKLEIQKELFEEIKKHKEAIKIEEQQGYLPWMYENTINVFNVWNPYVTDYKTCGTAWLALVGTGVIIFLLYNSNCNIWTEIKHLKADMKWVRSQSIRSTEKMNTRIDTSTKTTNIKLDNLSQAAIRNRERNHYAITELQTETQMLRQTFNKVINWINSRFPGNI